MAKKKSSFDSQIGDEMFDGNLANLNLANSKELAAKERKGFKV